MTLLLTITDTNLRFIFLH